MIFCRMNIKVKAFHDVGAEGVRAPVSNSFNFNADFEKIIPNRKKILDLSLSDKRKL